MMSLSAQMVVILAVDVAAVVTTPQIIIRPAVFLFRFNEYFSGRNRPLMSEGSK